ncbi:hypothetical protein [Actinomycetospora straminea]|uniref:Uncharacterized protein n=1 Tax=Actinomycetospora straminea TaxID=663607 RepID=A0ABP9DTP8_9PSEU|nr:hypothetical protein [Actinomycetospora straminea]MDD7935231.1 hypothetical protein [Actinomycetospora straminea]
MPNRRTAGRTAALAGVLLAGGIALSACVFPAEPAPGSPSSPNDYSTGGFPPPGPAPQPGVITPDPVAPPAPADAPRPEEGPVPTEGPPTSVGDEPEPVQPAPPPGS